MINHKDMFHGSDLEKVEAVYGIPKEKITSFSANVNPLGISGRLRNELASHIDCITSYPDREYTALREAIAAYCGTDKDYVLVGNGSTELISLLMETRKPKRALILGPTYSEYEREAGIAGGSCSYYPLREDQDFVLDTDAFCASLTDETDLLVICNPNNPTSSFIPRREMRKILDTCLAHGIFTMVDETYAEFADESSQVSAIPLCSSYDNLIVLRGTSKFFAAPGLRLGYAVSGNADVRAEIKSRQNPWSVNSLADAAGRIMFSDSGYIAKTKTLISGERSRLIEELHTWRDVKVYPAQANFLLFKILRQGVTAYDIFDSCIRQGFMIRNCASFPFLDESFIRFCFMMPEDNTRLLQMFRKCLDQ